jgi:hypothetical protein
MLGELEGREWHLQSIQGIVRDSRSGQDLQAFPAALSAEDIRQLAGSSVLPAHGQLTIPLQFQFLIGEPSYYVDGPHELQVTVFATVD